MTLCWFWAKDRCAVFSLNLLFSPLSFACLFVTLSKSVTLSLIRGFVGFFAHRRCIARICFRKIFCLHKSVT